MDVVPLVCPLTLNPVPTEEGEEDGGMIGAPCIQDACHLFDQEDNMCVVRSILGELKLISAALFGSAPGGSA